MILLAHQQGHNVWADTSTEEARRSIYRYALGVLRMILVVGVAGWRTMFN